MGNRRVYVLVAVALIVVWMLWQRDEGASDAELGRDREPEGAPEEILRSGAQTEPGLAGLTEEQRARLKKPERLEPVLALVTRGGKPVVGRRVRLSGTRLDVVGSHVFAAATNERGEVRHALPPGLYTIGLERQPAPTLERAPFRVRSLDLRMARDVFTHKEPLREPVHFQLPPGRVVARVTGKAGEPLAGAVVRVGLTSATTDEQGEAHFSELQAGALPVTAHKDGFVLAGEQGELDVAAEGVTHLDLRLVEAGRLQLRFRQRETGVLLHAPRGLRPRVTPVGRKGKRLPFPATFPAATLKRYPRLLEVGTLFGAVLPGRYRVALEDERFVKGGQVAIRAQPFDPVEPQAARVVAGKTTTLEFAVLPRAFVDLRVLDEEGKATRRKVSLGVVRRPENGGAPQHFATLRASDPWYRYPRFGAHLPPGTYDVEIKRAGKRESHELIVGREDVSRGFRPPER